MREFKGYRGSNTLKRSGVQIEWTPEQLEEIIKCQEDPIYFASNYMYVHNVDNGLIKLPLYPYQKDIINSALNNRFTVVECARQAGKTTSMTSFVLWYILFNSTVTVGIAANKGETAREILGRIQLAYEHLPKWMQQGVVEWNKGSFELENGSRVIAGATSKSGLRGYTFNMLIIDEAAFVENWNQFFTAMAPTISSGKTTKMILVSTVNGLNHFYEITNNARKGINNYNLISVTWKDVPGRDEKWKQETLSSINFDYEKFRQEYENEYLGSSGTLIAGWKLQQLIDEILNPISKSMQISQYEPPRPGRTYVGVADVSRGKGLDYSALQIIDVSEMPYRQVLTYRDNMVTPGDFAEVINRVGRQYNHASILIEVNDIGGQVADSLYYDFEYENMLFSESAGSKGKVITQAWHGNKTDRGIRTTKTVKAVGCSMLKLLIESDQLKISDKDTVEELKTFSKKNNTYEAEEGKTDDLTMCLVLFSWFSEQQFFKDMTSINTLQQVRDHKEEAMEQAMMPLGFHNDGLGDEYVHFGNESWIVVNQNFDDVF